MLEGLAVEQPFVGELEPRDHWQGKERERHEGRGQPRAEDFGEPVAVGVAAGDGLRRLDGHEPGEGQGQRRQHFAVVVGDGQLVTDHLIEPIEPRDGALAADPARDIIKLVVVNRYAPARPAVALVKGFGLTRGAIASSVAHDSHHVIGVGATDEAVTAAVNEVIMRKGGLAVTDNNRKVLASLPLPLAGLMSIEPPETVARGYSDCDRLAKILGSRLTAPFMTLSFLALPVIPRLKLTDKGLFDGDTFQHVPLFLTP